MMTLEQVLQVLRFYHQREFSELQEYIAKNNINLNDPLPHECFNFDGSATDKGYKSRYHAHFLTEAVIHACQNRDGLTTLKEFLTNFKLNIDVDDKNGSPVQQAIINDNLEIFELLMTHDSEYQPSTLLKTDYYQYEARNPIYHATRAIHNGRKFLEILMARSKKTICDLANVHLDKEETLYSAATNNHNLGVLKYLIESGADVNTPDGKGRTPLIRSLFCGFLEGTVILLQNKADPFKKFPNSSKLMVDAFELIVDMVKNDDNYAYYLEKITIKKLEIIFKLFYFDQALGIQNLTWEAFKVEISIRDISQQNNMISRAKSIYKLQNEMFNLSKALYKLQSVSLIGEMSKQSEETSNPVYEPDAITAWINKRTEPSTNQPITLNDLIPNRALKASIEKRKADSTSDPSESNIPNI